MIKKSTMQRLNLTDDQISALSDLMHRESRMRELIVSCGVSPKITEKILRRCDAEKIDLSNEQGLCEAIREEYGDFIVQKRSN